MPQFEQKQREHSVDTQLAAQLDASQTAANTSPSPASAASGHQSHTWPPPPSQRLASLQSRSATVRYGGERGQRSAGRFLARGWRRASIELLLAAEFL